MATAINKTLDTDGNGDYLKFSVAKAAFYGDADGDLVTNDTVPTLLVKGASAANPDGFAHINNLTPDATRFLTIAGAPGFKHRGVYNATSMAGIARFDTLFDASLLLSEAYTRLKDILVVQRSNGGGGVSTLYVNGNDCLVERCMAVNHPTGVPTNETYGINVAITGDAVIRNTVVIVLPSATGHNNSPYCVYQAPGAITGEITYDNCTFIMLGIGVTTGGSFGVLVRNASDTIMRNCVIWGATVPVSGTLHASSSNNAYVGASGTGDVDLAGASIYDLFVDPDNYDFRPRRGSVLRGAGADLSAVFTDDVRGAPRPADGAYDIGGFQYQQEDGDGRRRGRFLLELPENVGVVNGVKKMVVEADTPTAARDAASAEFDNDTSWASATTTEIDASEVYEGATFTVAVEGVYSVTYTAVQGDTLDTIGAALAVLLNGSPVIHNSAYVSATNILTVAGAADGLGNKTIAASVKLPGARRALTASNGPIGTATDKGSAGAALTLQFRDSGVPKVLLKA
jgi:hypothetical protein